MGKLHLSKWWGLYALVPLMIALMVIDVGGAMSQTWHLILLAGIVCIVCALAPGRFHVAVHGVIGNHGCAKPT